MNDRLSINDLAWCRFFRSTGGEREAGRAGACARGRVQAESTDGHPDEFEKFKHTRLPRGPAACLEEDSFDGRPRRRGQLKALERLADWR